MTLIRLMMIAAIGFVSSLSYSALFIDGHRFVNSDGSLNAMPNGQAYRASTIGRTLVSLGWRPSSSEYREFTNLGLRPDATANTRRLELIGHFPPGVGGRPPAVSEKMSGSRPAVVPIPPQGDRRDRLRRPRKPLSMSGPLGRVNIPTESVPNRSMSDEGTQTDMSSIDEEETIDEERRFGIHRQRQLARTRWNMGIQMVRQKIRKDLQSKNYKIDLKQMKSVMQKLKGEAFQLHQVKQILEGSNLRLHQIGNELLRDNESAHNLIVLMQKSLDQAQSQIALLNSQIEELEKTIKSGIS